MSKPTRIQVAKAALWWSEHVEGDRDAFAEALSRLMRGQRVLGTLYVTASGPDPLLTAAVERAGVEADFPQATLGFKKDGETVEVRQGKETKEL